MLHHLDDLRRGFTAETDAVVIGSGAGGAVAVANLAAAGMRTALIEAGPQVKPAEMTRNAPLFTARYYWDGGMRLAGGSSQVPIMQGRLLGGSTVVNSAIMYKLPDWVRDIWIADEGLEALHDASFDRAFERAFERTHTAPTPLAVMGKRSLMIRDGLEAAGIESNPLPRAVVDCEGCNDCLTGCHHGNKQSVDLCYLRDAAKDGTEIYTCCEADRILFAGRRAVGVTGWVIDPIGRRRLERFTVRAKHVLLAAGAVNTPVLLLRSGIRGRRVGRHLSIHATAGCIAFSDEVVNPWVGATQGWGAICKDVRGLKYESLWAPTSLIMLRWGDIGTRFYEQMRDVKYATAMALVYRGNVTGRVTAGGDGQPKVKLWLSEQDVPVLMKALKRGIDGLFAAGARQVYPAVSGAKDEMYSPEDSQSLIDNDIRARDIVTTGNHIFGSCRMSSSADRGVVDPAGKVYGTEQLYVCDASIFPSPSAVNPQATIMALADLVSRRLGELEL